MEAQEPKSMMVNPNQVWFPHVLQIRSAAEVEPDMEMPKSKDGLALVIDINSDVRPEPGSLFHFGFQTVAIDKVIRERPSKGDWSGDFWNGVKPNFYRCTCHRVARPDKVDKKA